MAKIILNWKKSPDYFINLDNNTTLEFISPYVQKTKFKYNNVFVFLQQDDVGNRKVTFPDNVKWLGKEIPVLSKFPKAIDVISLYYYKPDKSYYAMFSLDMGI